MKIQVDRRFYERELDEEQRLYDEKNPVCRYYHISRRREVQQQCVEALDRFSGEGVLADIGCGTGTYLRDLAFNTKRTIGVELARSKTAIASERTRGSPVIVINGSATDIPLRSGSCHVVLCSEVIEHFREPLPVIAELVRIVRPGGFLVLSTPVRSDFRTWIGAVAGRRNTESRSQARPDQHGHYWYFAPRHLQGLIESLGSRVKRLATVPRLHFRGLPTLIRYRIVHPSLLIKLGALLPNSGATADLGGFAVFTAQKNA